MPDTLQWRDLVNTIRGRDIMPVEQHDQYDAIMRDWAAPLGFTLDRSTLEGGLWGIMMALTMTGFFQIQEEGIVGDEPSARQLARGIALTQYLLVKRIDALEPEQ
jgi:hypothetical protein